MTISEDCFAPFDLSKTRKFDRKKDQESLRKSFYKLGVQYFEVSCFTIKNWSSKNSLPKRIGI